jgi:hypothetical protein
LWWFPRFLRTHSKDLKGARAVQSDLGSGSKRPFVRKGDFRINTAEPLIFVRPTISISSVRFLPIVHKKKITAQITKINRKEQTQITSVFRSFKASILNKLVHSINAITRGFCRASWPEPNNRSDRSPERITPQKNFELSGYRPARSASKTRPISIEFKGVAPARKCCLNKFKKLRYRFRLAQRK